MIGVQKPYPKGLRMNATRDLLDRHVVLIEEGSDMMLCLRDAQTHPKLRVEHYRSVSEFVIGGNAFEPKRIFVETDALDPQAIDKIFTLIEFFGDERNSDIVAVTDFAPGAFDVLLTQAGCDLVLSRGELTDCLKPRS